MQEIEHIIGIVNNEPSTMNEITSESKKLESMKTEMEQNANEENLKSVSNIEYRIENSSKKKKLRDNCRLVTGEYL